MSTKKKAQIEFGEKIIDDPELERTLEERQALKERTKEYRKMDKKAKELIAKVISPLPFRIGRFIISAQPVPAKSVAFETTESTTISIKTADE